MGTINGVEMAEGYAELIEMVTRGDCKAVADALCKHALDKATLHRWMHILMDAYCPQHAFAGMLEVWKRAGADSDAIHLTRMPDVNTLLAFNCWQWCLSAYKHEQWQARVWALIDAGATQHGRFGAVSWVTDRIEGRRKAIALKRSALIAAFHCLRKRWGLPRDLIKAHVLGPLTREWMVWKWWREPRNQNE